MSATRQLLRSPAQCRRTFMEIMLKTIFQSQEIRVGETETIDVKAFPNKHSRPKAVSFHGVEGPRAIDSMSWRLQLKRSSASTNVSILNLTESQNNEFQTSKNNPSSSSDSEDYDASAESQEPDNGSTNKNSGLMFVKDSVIDLKEKSSKLSHHIHSLTTESASLCENLEQRQKEVEKLDKICNHLEKKLSCITQKLGDICGKRESLNNLKYEILKDMSSVQGFLQTAESRGDTTLLRDLNQNIITLCSGIKDLQQSLETAGTRAEPGRATEELEMTELITVIEEIRDSMAHIDETFESVSMLLKNVHRTVFHMNTRIESFVSQGSCAQEQQELLIDNIQDLRASMQSFHSLLLSHPHFTSNKHSVM